MDVLLSQTSDKAAEPLSCGLSVLRNTFLLSELKSSPTDPGGSSASLGSFGEVHRALVV